MASGIFAILDDIASLMDDVAVTAKVAAQKTAGILGDDLAVNAEKATGFLSSRELPVLWAITKGSLLNKVIIIPICLLLSAFLPVAIKVMLVLGGFYLAYEGVEKIVEYLFHRSKSKPGDHKTAAPSSEGSEKEKIKAAITTDFILSVEIVIIALGSVTEKSLPIQVVTVSIVAVLATIGVYGIVALIVRMDDLGYRLMEGKGKKGFVKSLGSLLVKALPVIIKTLSVVGTVALILVSGGIFTHNIEYLHPFIPNLPLIIKELIIGLTAGLIIVAVLQGSKKLFSLAK